MKIQDLPLLPEINGTEKIPTGGFGVYAVSINQLTNHVVGDLVDDLALKADQSTVDDLVATVASNLVTQAEKDASQDQAISAVGGGAKSYLTLASLNAAASPTINTLAYVSNDSTSSNNGMYTYNGSVWVKSLYDPLTQALAADAIIIADSLSKSQQTTSDGFIFADESGMSQVSLSKQLMQFFDTLSIESTNVDGINITNDMLMTIASIGTNYIDFGWLSADYIASDGLFIQTDDGLFAKEVFSDFDPTNTVTPPIVYVDTDKLMFTKTLVGWDDQDMIINVPSLLPDRASRYVETDFIATIGSTNSQFSAPYHKTSNLELSINTAKLGTNARLTARDTDQLFSGTHLDMSVRSMGSASSSTAFTVLCIGDSITNRQGPDYIKNALVQRGYNPVFIGTHRGQKYQSDSLVQGTGEFAEGREGWRFADYTYRLNTNGYAPVTDVSAYLALPNFDRRKYWNPFIRQSTGTDAPNTIQNGYVFDIKFYLDRFGFTYPNVIVIALGVNDILQSGSATVSADCQIMIDSILTQLPSCKIVLTCPSFSIQRESLWSAGALETINGIQTAINNANSPRIMLAPAWAMCSPTFGYQPDTTVAVNTITGSRTAGYSDPTHPMDANRANIWTTIAAYVAASI